jgi:hypothetical protein
MFEVFLKGSLGNSQWQARNLYSLPINPAEQELLTSRPQIDYTFRKFWIATPIFLGGMILVSLLALVAHGATNQVNANQIAVIDPELAELLVEAGPEQRFDILVYLYETNNISTLSLPNDETQRRQAIVFQLRQSAEKQQAGILDEINQLEQNNIADFERSLWIVNAIQLNATREAILSLAERDDVEIIKNNTSYQFVDPQELGSSLTETIGTWGPEKIRAPHVWHGLGIDGSGVTVAIMDTGVDWLHPILNGNYRGNLDNGSIEHEGNWYDAVEGNPEPADPHGHGTHVAGTAVGQQDYGVAPGANWIGVRILNEFGSGTIGDIHSAFQWLLAPAGDPSLAPDLVNNSWTGPPQMTDFVQDIDILKEARIIPLFAAGNNGPEEFSIGSPADYPGVIAVGAIDDTNNLAWFSSVGPSKLTGAIKPTFVAPGAQIISSLPDASFGFKNGTSMATPHATGTYALLLSVDPNLSEGQITRIVTSTAKLEATQFSGNEYGWGRIDAYSAVESIMDEGSIEVVIQLDGISRENVPVAVTNDKRIELKFLTDQKGAIKAELLPGQYNVSATQFGYSSTRREGVIVTKGQASSLTMNLPRLPFGSVGGQLNSSVITGTISGTLIVSDSTMAIESEHDGSYFLELPVGDYELMASATGFGIVRSDISIEEGKSIVRDFYLEPISRTLLVDSGAWYYASQQSYFQTALLANNHSFDLLTIRNPFSDTPTAEDLSSYELVIWSAPLDSPGSIGAGQALATYLQDGGNLLISGQEVAFLDGQGLFTEAWWYSQLNGIFVGEAGPPFKIDGADNSIFAGMEIQLNDLDSAQNQVDPDKSIAGNESLSSPVFHFEDGNSAGLQISNCEPFRILYFGFGLEGVGGAEVRDQIVDKSLDFFSEPDVETGMNLGPYMLEDLVVQGTQHNLEFNVLNLSETLTDTIKLTTEGSEWPVQLETNEFELGPCQSQTLSFTVTVPANLPTNTTENFDLVAHSTLDPALGGRIPVVLKTPNYILLVDDDRWYDQSAVYNLALEQAGFEFDFWEIGENMAGRGSPPLSLIQAYPIVIWYTGYDWFRPITNTESDILYKYLTGGGRLFLTSQDYMYYHSEERLTKDFFNVDGYRESLEPTQTFGNPRIGFAGSLEGPLPLDYGPYQNFSDGLIPAADGQVSVWHNKGLPGGVNTAGLDWRSVFWSLPFETLPVEEQPEAINAIIGWLGDLGESTFIVDKRSSQYDLDNSRFYTLTISNEAGTQPNFISITNTLPMELSIDEDSILGDAAYQEETRFITWTSVLSPGQIHVISYQAELDSELPEGKQIDNWVDIHYQRHDLSHRLNAATWIGTADLSSSDLIVSPTVGLPGTEIVISSTLNNTGSDSAFVSATLFMLEEFELLTETIKVSNGSVFVDEDSLLWELEIGPRTIDIASFSVQVGSVIKTKNLPIMLVIEDKSTGAMVKSHPLTVRPYQNYFPVAIFNSS